MVGMDLHGRDNGGDIAGSRDGDFVRISINGDIEQGPASRFIQVGMVGMGLHGRDNGGDTAGSRDGDFVFIINCEACQGTTTINIHVQVVGVVIYGLDNGRDAAIYHDMLLFRALRHFYRKF